MVRFIALLACLAATPAAAQQPKDNAEMQALFVADQAARQTITSPRGIDRAFAVKLVAEDEQRRTVARRLLDAGALHTADDYYAAAFVFQHGKTADDYLLAHSLALAAAARGKAEAAWIAAATLDRYLQKIGQKQVFGTQYIAAKDTGPTMEPYDRALVPDSLRAALGVPNRAAQDTRLTAMRAAIAPAKP